MAENIVNRIDKIYQSEAYYTNSESIDYKFIQENAEIDLQISAEFS